MAEKSRRKDRLSALELSTESSELPKPAAFSRKQKWLHDKKDLLYGSITYRTKFLGVTEVGERDGDMTVKSAVDKLKLSTHGKRLPEVDIAISVSFIVITEVKSKTHVSRSKLQKITYCSESRMLGDKIFAYIVAWKPAEKKYHCFCFETQSPSNKISMTVGQAFHLAYERFLEAKQAQDQFMSLRRKLKTPKEKENFAKKLTELHRAPSMKELADLAVVPTPSKHHQHIEERQQLWKKLSQGTEEFEQQDDAIAQRDKRMVEGWKRVTTALEPFNESADQSVKKPRSVEDVDSAINMIENQFESLEDFANVEEALKVFDELQLDVKHSPPPSLPPRNHTKQTTDESTSL